MKLIVIRGLPGCGKSKYANELASEFNGSVVSVDTYFEREGEYKFKPQEISRAYGYIEGQIDVLMNEKQECIIADGIHQSERSLDVYKQLASKYGYELDIQYPPYTHIWDINGCYKHSIHRTPFRVIKKIAEKFERSPNEELAA